MKKKALLLIFCLVCLVLLTGCKSTIRDSLTGEERTMIGGRLVELKSTDDDCGEICYDSETKVCYYIIHSSAYTSGLSPYYIIGEDEKPEIAVYGVNYR